MNKKYRWLRCIILLSILCIVSGCSTIKNLQFWQSYSKDLVNRKYYKTETGDTLYSIGFRSDYGYKRLAIWNNILPPYTIKKGQVIKLFQLKQKVIKKKWRNKQIKPKQKNGRQTKKIPIISTNNKKVLKFYWQWPLKGIILKRFSPNRHKGITIAGKLGQNVLAAASGRCVYSGVGFAGYGNLLIIKHNSLYLSVYANNSILQIREGQSVKKGQVIAKVGQKGNQKPSLHFEIRKNGKSVNPLRYLPK